MTLVMLQSVQNRRRALQAAEKVSFAPILGSAGLYRLRKKSLLRLIRIRA
jgi:hypothetical protein